MSNPIYDEVDGAPEPQTLDEIRHHQAQLRSVVEFGDKAKRLAEDPDFKALILDFYMVKEPARLVGFLAAGNIPEGQRDVVTAELRAIGHLKNTLSGIVQAGASAAHDLAEVNGAIAEYLEEGGE